MAELDDAIKALRAAPGDKARRRVHEALLHCSLHVQAASRDNAEGSKLALAFWRKGKGSDGPKCAAAFSSRDAAKAWNADSKADWIEVPSAWVMREALKGGADALIVNAPQGIELTRDELGPLADGKVPDPKPKLGERVPPPKAAPEQKLPPAPLPGAADEPASPRWKIGPPEIDIPEEALEYLRHVFEPIDEVTEGWFFTASPSGEPPSLVLGLRLDLPPADWDDFLACLEQLDDVPGFDEGLAVCALNDETLKAVQKRGLRL